MVLTFDVVVLAWLSGRAQDSSTAAVEWLEAHLGLSVAEETRERHIESVKMINVREMKGRRQKPDTASDRA